jgi:ABC-type Mn2+/Zn2+ transport system ATPase subunit
MTDSKVPTLELQQITAGYGEQNAIQNISVCINEGERVGLIGPNGAGKSTLFRTIVGLLPQKSGTILINGSRDRSARQQAAYVPQFEDVDWNFPVAVIDVVEMGLARQIGWLRLPGGAHHAQALQALARVGLTNYAKRQIGELSGGQKRRVFIARALAQGANILLLDEPFSGVDAVAQSGLLQILDQLRADGVTLLFATHDLNLAATGFDKLMIVNRELVAYGTPDEVFTPSILSRSFGGQLAVWHNGEEVVMLVDQHA